MLCSDWSLNTSHTRPSVPTCLLHDNKWKYENNNYIQEFKCNRFNLIIEHEGFSDLKDHKDDIIVPLHILKIRPRQIRFVWSQAVAVVVVDVVQPTPNFADQRRSFIRSSAFQQQESGVLNHVNASAQLTNSLPQKWANASSHIHCVIM